MVEKHEIQLDKITRKPTNRYYKPTSIPLEERNLRVKWFLK